ncbi:MAG: TIGR00730 family Rossman fold protein [bacterium]
MKHQHRISLRQIKALAGEALRRDVEEKARLNRIEEEFRQGFNFLETLPKSVSIFGSSQSMPGSLYYEKARTLASRLVSERGLAVVTGGGPGIMEAANRGASEAGGVSAGLHIDIKNGEPRNSYATTSTEFHYFFARKVALSFAASMYIFFPGGFGTLDEFFELITLIQTDKIEPIPIICYGASYWDPLERFMDYYMLRHDAYIQRDDLKLYTITDDIEDILRATKSLEDRS